MNADYQNADNQRTYPNEKKEEDFKRSQNKAKEQKKLKKLLESKLDQLKEEVLFITNKQKELMIDKDNKVKIKRELVDKLNRINRDKDKREINVKVDDKKKNANDITSDYN